MKATFTTKTSDNPTSTNRVLFRSLLSEIRRKPEKKKRKNEESEDDAKSDVSAKHKVSQGISGSNFPESLEEHIKVKSFQST